jgi:hypothetical protein
MRNRRRFLLAAGVAVAALYGLGIIGAQRGWFWNISFAFDEDDIGGVVTGPNGPEAGVWVIAETTDLPTKFAKIVVTDETGRYVIPDLPTANYDVWVRGYGLVDSPKVKSEPGKVLSLTAVPAPTPAAAAEYYPAAYWYSLLKIPDKSEFPGHGTGPGGNGIPASLKSQGAYLELAKIDGCLSCHQIGNKATRMIRDAVGSFDSTYDAWERRIQSGQASSNMVRIADRLGTERWLATLADWSDRIAAGELPTSSPPRPQGVERNLVLTLWDWASPTSYIDEQGSADKRNPSFNAGGPIFGVSGASSDVMTVFDPKANAKSEIKIPVRDPKTPTTKNNPMFFPSPYFGAERIWGSQGMARQAMLDEKGRVWITTRIRPSPNPAYCKRGSNHPSAKLFPLAASDRQLSFYDLNTKEFTLIDTCFTTHHMNFDRNGVLWFSSGASSSDVVGWFDTNKFDATHDERASQGWTAIVTDTNGNQRRDAYVEPGGPVDLEKDKRFTAGFYGVSVSPADGAIWGSVPGYPGAIVRLSPGANPPATALAEYYESPADDPQMPGYSPRGIDVDSNGVVWVSMSSGHLASFDRGKCKGPFYGPEATGTQCPEGWTLYPFPAPQFLGITDKGSAEGGYFTYVDRFDTFGLGQDVPINTANISDALVALVNGTFVTLRVPYPMGFYAKALDGRIDDPGAGWKGKGLWSAFSERAVQHIEGGKGTTSKVVHFQLRPDPLAH